MLVDITHEPAPDWDALVARHAEHGVSPGGGRCDRPHLLWPSHLLRSAIGNGAESFDFVLLAAGRRAAADAEPRQSQVCDGGGVMAADAALVREPPGAADRAALAIAHRAKTEGLQASTHT